jgi:L-2-hydroxycarboxylate dehydrogenase (NAD+)
VALLANYPQVATDSAVEAGVLVRRVGAIFERCAMQAGDARLLAESLVAADVRGVHSHGVLRVPDYVNKLTREGVDPIGRPAVASDRQAALVIDGGNAMGQIACDFAMRQALDRAARTGVAAAAVRGSNHCGALFYFAMKALERDMIGLVSTNALPTMAPWGGRDKILGINPLAVAVPSAAEPPIVFDGAFSASSHGKIRVYHQKGLPIPHGWALDAEGNPTSDAGEALAGLLQPIGGFKGVGLAIIMGVLSSLLSGAAFGAELGDMVNGARAGADGQFVLAIQVAAFEDAGRFKSRVDEIVRSIRNSATAPGYERCYAPGELEHENEQQYRRHGIPLSADTLAGLAESERALGIG